MKRFLALLVGLMWVLVGCAAAQPAPSEPAVTTDLITVYRSPS